MPISKQGHAYFTQMEYEKARAASALEYALRSGFDLIPKGRYFYMREHDSMVFLPNGRWHWNSRGLHGAALEFARHYEHLSLPEAVLAINRVMEAPCAASQRKAISSWQSKTTPLFVLPHSEEQRGKMYDYLIDVRGLDGGIVEETVQLGLIYMTRSKGHNNVVFVCTDDEGVPRSAMLRGLDNGSTFKGEVPGSNKGVLFHLPWLPGSDCLAVFESAIDAMSHATLAKMDGGDWRKMGRVAQGGNTEPGTAAKFLAQHPQFQTVYACFDNDDAGRALEANLRAELEGYTVISLSPPAEKDWNAYLLSRLPGSLADRRTVNEKSNQNPIQP